MDLDDQDMNRRELAAIINKIVTNSCDAITVTMIGVDKAQSILGIVKIVLLALILWRVW